MKRVPLSIRIAAVVTVSALAACGGGGGDSPAASTAASPAAAAASPAASPAAAPAPAASVSTDPNVTTATAVTGPVGDPVVGKQLFDAMPAGQPSCLSCHTVADVRSRARTEEGYRYMIDRAINANVNGSPINSDMANALRGIATAPQIQNIAAFLKWGS